MGTSEKTFNQVKAILSKLDRNIDELRDKRLHPQPAGIPAGMVPPVVAAAPPAHPSGNGPASNNGRPSFGRAQPIRPDRT